MTASSALVRLPGAARSCYNLRSWKLTFLTLPLKLRTRTYQYVFDDARLQLEDDYNAEGERAVYYKVATTRFEILLVAKKCYSEAKVLFYQTAEVVLDYYLSLDCLPRNPNLLRHVELVKLEYGNSALFELIRNMRALEKVEWRWPFSLRSMHLFPFDGTSEGLENKLERTLNDKYARNLYVSDRNWDDAVNLVNHLASNIDASLKLPSHPQSCGGTLIVREFPCIV